MVAPAAAFTVLLLSIIHWSPASAVGPWCFACADAFHPAICLNVVQCGEHESCITEKRVSNNGGDLYTTGCKATADCVKRVKKRAVDRALLCSECCDGTLCNVEGCGATKIRDPGRKFCLNCGFVQHPKDCDTVEHCSQDQQCSMSLQKKLGLNFYQLDCQPTTSCPAATATLASNNAFCCDDDLCNSNDLGVDPSTYTTTPKPSPGPATASFDDPVYTYNVTHVPGETMDLVCHVRGGPAPTVTWTFSNDTTTFDIKTGFKRDASGDSILSVPTPGKSDSGQYTCTADNKLGPKVSDSLNVTVLVPPFIQGPLNQSLTIDLRNDINLPCDVAQDNSTKVRWHVPSNVKSYRVNNDSSLTVYNVHEENEGPYSCTAENSEGRTEKLYMMYINGTQTATVPSCTCPTTTPVTCPPPSALGSLTTSLGSTSSKTRTALRATTMTTPATTVTSPTTTVTSPATTVTTPATTVTTPATTVTTPATTMTSPPTTSTSTRTTPSTTTPRSTPTNTHTPTTTVVTSTGTPGNPVYNQFQDIKANSVNILQCPVSRGTTVTWRRKIEDYDHSSTYYSSDRNVLTINSQLSVSLKMTGVYECLEGGVVRGQFVIYNRSQNTTCAERFGDRSTTKGVVLQAKCGNCGNNNGLNPAKLLTINDLICENAIHKGAIFPLGGNVTYIIKDRGVVEILRQNGQAILIP
ncbi:mucin-2-like [Aplysia californica]|uniref:Mucin-2-like n=1 Tax=Aplysia californica TaxID=6500 RepID=A0ABM0JYH4_APLCA|nr:mucin-2-like [Aplysia californica]